MDMAGGINDSFESGPQPEEDAAVSDRPVEIGTDERRMQVRAYNHWVSLLRGRAFPGIDSLDPAGVADFAPFGVVLDFSQGIENPGIRYLGAALRSECGVDGSITHVAQVPSRSLLSRLTDHYLQIIANRAPIGFEAEFVSQRGHNTLYRGILMPFSSGSDTIDYLYGVINWKEMVDAATQARLSAEVEQSRRVAPRAAAAPVWADGPSAGIDSPAAATLAERLLRARESVAAARTAGSLGDAALHRALASAYDFALAAELDPAGFAALLAEAGVAQQPDAPMVPPVRLVFGTDYPAARLAEFAAVLAQARRVPVAQGGLEAHLAGTEGGIAGLLHAARAERGPVSARERFARAAAELRNRPPIAHVAIDAGADEFVLLLGRAAAAGGVDIVARVPGESGFTARAVRRAAA